MSLPIRPKNPDNANLSPVYQDTSNVRAHSFKSNDNQDTSSEFRNTREAFGDVSKPAAISQHRAADKFEDYAFKNLAKGNLDDTNIPSSNKYMGFVRDSGAVQTLDKTNESKTATVQPAHPGIQRSSFSPEMRMLAHGGSTVAFLLANLKMNKGMVGSLRNTAIFGLLAGALINPSIFDPILGRKSSQK